MQCVVYTVLLQCCIVAQPAYCLLMDILVCNKSCLRFAIMLRHGMLQDMLFMLQQYRM